MAVSILRSVLLKHAAYILHQFIELPHLFLTKLLDAFVLYARYDLISYPPDLPSSFREADDLGPSIGRVRHPLHVTRSFKLVDGVEQRPAWWCASARPGRSGEVLPLEGSEKC
jgi:hypothetical protein